MTNDWLIYTGSGVAHDAIDRLPSPPSWRVFQEGVTPRRLGTHHRRAATYQASSEEIELVNAAMYLRRPLLVTGKPGTGKSTLAHSVAYELRLGEVLEWPITSRSTLQEGLYKYDAIARLQDTNLARDDPSATRPGIGDYLRLGPLGTAFVPRARPRVLLIDELDKSDIDLPNDLLTIFEKGQYEIPELTRIAAAQRTVPVRDDRGDEQVPIVEGHVQCQEFPLVIITSNEEREFPPAFLRRCLKLRLQAPGKQRLEAIVRAHLGDDVADQSEDLIAEFLSKTTHGDLATDQLLNAIYLAFHHAWPDNREHLAEMIMQYLNSPDG